MKDLFVMSLVAALVLAVPRATAAQVSIGPELSIGDDVDFGIGASLAGPLAAIDERVEWAARITIFFPDGPVDYWELDGDLRYLFDTRGENRVTPFVLGGLAIGNFSIDTPTGDRGDTEVGLRAGGGFTVPIDSVMLIGEGAIGIGDIPDFVFRTGISFNIGN